MKECTKCRNRFPLTTEYFYQIKRKSGVAFESWCKGAEKSRQPSGNKKTEKLQTKPRRITISKTKIDTCIW